MSSARAAGGPKRQLTLLDATSIIVGIIIGAGIYETTPLIAVNAGSAAALLGLWVVGGLIALVGALCYVELSSAYPREGGDYVFLTEAYGRRAGFLFVWSEFWIVRPGNVGMMAFIFARYAQQLWPLRFHAATDAQGLLTYALAAVIVLGGINLLGVKSGKWTQNLLSTVKVLGLLAIFAAGMLGQPTPLAAAVAAPAEGSWQLALVLVLFTYGGWNEMSYVAAEVRQPDQNIFRALLLGTLLVILVYVLANLAFLRILGIAGMIATDALAADAVRPLLGERAARAVSALVCVSCLGAINGMLFTGARIYYALGTDRPMYHWLARWNAALDTPARALAAQTVLAVVLVIGFRGDEQGFVQLLNFTAPAFWFFMFMVAVSLFILRYKDPTLPRPHRVPLYPWTPIAFCLVTALLFQSSFTYALTQWSKAAGWAIVILLVGLAVSFVDDHDPRALRST